MKDDIKRILEYMEKIDELEIDYYDDVMPPIYYDNENPYLIQKDMVREVIKTFEEYRNYLLKTSTNINPELKYWDL